MWSQGHRARRMQGRRSARSSSVLCNPPSSRRSPSPAPPRSGPSGPSGPSIAVQHRAAQPSRTIVG
eukprot:318560-Alexandrium_andersonii.AAC.1